MIDWRSGSARPMGFSASGCHLWFLIEIVFHIIELGCRIMELECRLAFVKRNTGENRLLVPIDAIN